MVDYELIAYPIFKSFSKFRKINYKKIIQSTKFEYGIKIRNVGEGPFEGGIIKNIKIIPFKKDVDFNIVSDKKIIEIPPLEPGDTNEIWFDRTSSPLSGPFWLNFNLEDKTENKVIFIQNTFDFNIKDEHLLQQEITNYLLIILTIITVAISIWKLFL